MSPRLFKNFLAIFFLSTVVLGSGSVALGGKGSKRSCEESLFPVKEDLSPSDLEGIKVTKFWEDPSLLIDPNKTSHLNGIMVWQLADFFKKKSRLPLSHEWQSMLVALIKKLAPVSGRPPSKTKEFDDSEPSFEATKLAEIAEEGLDRYFELKKAPGNIDALLSLSVKYVPDSFETARARIRKFAAGYFIEHLRPPQILDISHKLSLPENLVNLLVEPREEFWKSVFRDDGTVYTKVQSKITRAFVNAMTGKERPTHLKTAATTPDVDAIHRALVRGNPQLLADHVQGKFSVQHVSWLLNQNREQATEYEKTRLPMPVLFPEGLVEIETQALLGSPHQMTNYRPSQIGGLTLLARAQILRKVIEDSPAFIMTSANAGMPINADMLASMKIFAKEKGYPIVVKIVGGMTLIPPELLNDPQIYILTETIENRYLRLWDIEVSAKQMRPITSKDNATQVDIGQLSIIGHPQLRNLVLPTGSNHIRQTEIWTTGSISEDYYPSRLLIQDQTSRMAKMRHSLSFLIVEKADSKAGELKEGVQNFWHPRPVIYKDSRNQGGWAGFIDLGQRYELKEKKKGIEVKRNFDPPTTFYVGDLHERFSSQDLLVIFREIIRKYGITEILFPDSIDGDSHNRWNDLLVRSQAHMHTEGRLDIHLEYMQFVQTINVLQEEFPDLVIVIQKANHNDRAAKLLQNPSETQRVINGPFIEELQWAMSKGFGRDPMEYILKWRNKVADSLGQISPSVKKYYEENAIRVADPERIVVLHAGEPFHAGTYALHHHGHRGANGAKGSANGHARSNKRGVTADSHVKSIIGENIVVGVSTDPREMDYAVEGYSAWSMSPALIYQSNDTAQLLTYSNLAKNYMADPDVKPLPPEAFFGDDPLVIVEHDNDRLNTGVHIIDQWSHFTRPITNFFESLK